MDFVLNDENIVNSYGFVVMNDGCDLERFRKYPVMLHNHNGDELIGRWDNLRIEGSKLIGTASFDGEDEFAKKIEGKVSRGFLRGASLGFHVKEHDMRAMPDGSIVPAVTKCELMEASVVSLPSNAGALKLYDQCGKALEGEMVQLNINSIINQKQSEMDKKEISLTAQALTALGLSTEADAAALSAAVVALSARAEAAEKTLAEQKKAAATALVDKAITEGRLSADKKDDFVNLATYDFAQAQSIIEAIPARQTVGDKIKPGSKSDLSASREDWDYKRWVKEDPQGLKRLKAENPQAFEELRSQLVGL